MMRSWVFAVVLSAGTVWVPCAMPVALAQYDRDGRYIPSPLGVPADPYARPIPVYPGNPGGAIGTPSWPRGPETPPPPPVLQPPRIDPVVPSTRSLPVPLSVERCEQDWTRATGLTRVEFRRRCALLLRKRG